MYAFECLYHCLLTLTLTYTYLSLQALSTASFTSSTVAPTAPSFTAAAVPPTVSQVVVATPSATAPMMMGLFDAYGDDDSD